MEKRLGVPSNMSYIMCRYDSMRRKLAALIVKFLV
jgi:hypothetical protein